MARLRRYDSGPMGNVEALPGGGVRIPATLTRSGIFEYPQADGSIRREYRPPTEVFDPASLDSARAVALTDLHPVDRTVTAGDWRRKAVGHVGDDVRQDGDHVAATVYVQDAATIDLIKAGERPQISMGYDQELVDEPGVTPEGERYDAIQTQIRYNHAALVPRGRAGATVGLRLDADGHQIEDDTQPMKIKIAGKEYEAGSAEAQAAIDALVRRADAAEAETRRVAVVSKVERLPAKLRAGIRTDAGEDEIMISTLAKIVPGFKAEGKSPEFIQGAFAVALEMALGVSPAAPAAPPPAAPPEEPEPVESLDADEPADDDEEEKKPAAGAAAIRADVFEGRSKVSTMRQATAELPPDLQARARMVERGARLGSKGQE